MRKDLTQLRSKHSAAREAKEARSLEEKSKSLQAGAESRVEESEVLAVEKSFEEVGVLMIFDAFCMLFKG